MFDIVNQAMFFLLKSLQGVTGSYVLAIIALTVIIRLLTWPLNSSQTRSMKKMQELQPKMKALQEKYKDNPQKMQEQLMKFYAEHKFNPFAGCLPMLIQIPIFIGLYGAINSPDFLSIASHEKFFFIENIAHTLQSHAGNPEDGTFSIHDNDRFVTGHNIEVTLPDGTQREYRIRDTHKALKISPTPMIPGKPIRLTLDLQQLGETGFSPDFVSKNVESARLIVVDDSTKEIETIIFRPAGGMALNKELPTVMGDKRLHTSVLILIVLYGLLMLLYQKISTPTAAMADKDNPQAQMMKFMPLMFVGVLFFIPMPAGVLLYLVTTTLLMFVQTLWVNITDGRKQNSNGAGNPSEQIIDIKSS